VRPVCAGSRVMVIEAPRARHGPRWAPCGRGERGTTRRSCPCDSSLRAAAGCSARICWGILALCGGERRMRELVVTTQHVREALVVENLDGRSDDADRLTIGAVGEIKPAQAIVGGGKADPGHAEDRHSEGFAACPQSASRNRRRCHYAYSRHAPPPLVNRFSVMPVPVCKKPRKYGAIAQGTTFGKSSRLRHG